MQKGRNKLPFVGCRLPPDLLAYLTAEAKRDQRPMGNLIRKILSEWQVDHAAKQRAPRANGKERPLIKVQPAG